MSGVTYQGGTPAVMKQSIFEESATQRHKIGERIALNDRVFRYALNGAANLTVGKLVTGVTSPQVNKSVLAAAIGDFKVTVVTSAANANFAEGYLLTHDGTGEGYNYKIVSSSANAATATSTDVVLYDPIQVALVASATSEVTLLYNPWWGTVVQATMALPVVGVNPIAVTAAYYYWCQTWGPCAVMTEGTPAVSMRLTGDGTTFGAVTDDAAASFDQIYGYNMTAVGVDGEYTLADLRISP